MGVIMEVHSFEKFKKRERWLCRSGVFLIEIFGMIGYGVFIGLTKDGLEWYYPASISTVYIIYSIVHETWAF